MRQCLELHVNQEQHLCHWRPGLMSNGTFVESFPVEFHFSHMILYDVDCLRFEPVEQIMEVWRDGLWASLIV
ncbi:hypothetical protein COCSUDRAFT_31936 [Coccomyxa subellipsoidea C-169]|uniref:Uncharacterized protein n=1 Tax=Coccomyxa subellipsoidea (strain C-169) TaxID=574566 RepID=I0Z939_COCSC|nr:hypothetical protein COCSUDRAFT_31936 [Coccomyxa subellipsoidea C-169]EIE27158.1 hypothetical protein COCSUDRAFT_31936 [Coccomyxa subellipsoidea C-169]|eukprot:XP_005651702.1 hypothetical protein COCSUDRAFT_31936 [Coccomyxa subellipsoidea C-169]